ALPPPALTPLPLHDALPISRSSPRWASCRPAIHPAPGTSGERDSRRVRRERLCCGAVPPPLAARGALVALAVALPGRPWAGEPRSEEHTSELQSRFELVCRL